MHVAAEVTALTSFCSSLEDEYLCRSKQFYFKWTLVVSFSHSHTSSCEGIIEVGDLLFLSNIAKVKTSIMNHAKIEPTYGSMQMHSMVLCKSIFYEAICICELRESKVCERQD